MNIDFPEALEFLFEPARYKVAYGGRGGAKSWGFARALLILGSQKPLRILCTREFQSSINDSVHKLLADQIINLGLQDFYQVLQTSIRAKNGTEIAFAGLRHNISNLKSFEGVDICWVEEAQNTSRHSWSVLIPTLRKAGSEIWVSFNPDLEEDETYQRFVINTPPNSLVHKINWSDNPWFPQVLKDELGYLKEKNYDEYLNVWEGYCKQAVEGAVYGGELRKAEDEKRITTVPYIPNKSVHTFWDLGNRDGTAIWFIQQIGFEFHVIDYYYNCHHKLNHYLGLLQSKPYLYHTHWLPHDAENEHLSYELNTKTQISRAYPNSTVRIVPGAGKPDSINDGIEQVRNVFDRCWFDRENTADGISCLRHYRYGKDIENGKTSRRPVEDDYTHGADAFRYFAMSLSKINNTQDSAPIVYSNKGIV